MLQPSPKGAEVSIVFKSKKAYSFTYLEIMKKLTLFVALLLLPFVLDAQTSEHQPSERKITKATRTETQKFLISTNLYDWADYGTINFGFGYVLGRHFSLDLGAKYNDWQFKTNDHVGYTMHKQKTASVGVRYWPWYVFSGWWIAAKGQYSDTTTNGAIQFTSKKALGAGLSTGYTLMITKKFNIEFGAGFWGGKYLDYVLDVPSTEQSYGEIKDTFFGWNDLNISLQFLF